MLEVFLDVLVDLGDVLQADEELEGPGEVLGRLVRCRGPRGVERVVCTCASVATYAGNDIQ